MKRHTLLQHIQAHQQLTRGMVMRHPLVTYVTGGQRIPSDLGLGNLPSPSLDQSFPGQGPQSLSFTGGAFSSSVPMPVAADHPSQLVEPTSATNETSRQARKQVSYAMQDDARQPEHVYAPGQEQVVQRVQVAPENTGQTLAVEMFEHEKTSVAIPEVEMVDSETFAVAPEVETVDAETFAVTPEADDRTPQAPFHHEHDRVSSEQTGHSYSHGNGVDTARDVAGLRNQRPRRGSIQEQPLQMKTVQPETVSVQLSSARHPIDRKEGEGVEEPKSAAQIEADMLFTGGTQRTPQEWLALLTRSETTSHPDNPSIGREQVRDHTASEPQGQRMSSTTEEDQATDSALSKNQTGVVSASSSSPVQLFESRSSSSLSSVSGRHPQVVRRGTATPMAAHVAGARRVRARASSIPMPPTDRMEYGSAVTEARPVPQALPENALPENVPVVPGEDTSRTVLPVDERGQQSILHTEAMLHPLQLQAQEEVPRQGQQSHTHPQERPMQRKASVLTHQHDHSIPASAHSNQKLHNNQEHHRSNQEHRPLAQPSSDQAQDWGNLPAPWEPLPDWMTAPASPSVPEQAPRPPLMSSFVLPMGVSDQSTEMSRASETSVGGIDVGIRTTVAAPMQRKASDPSSAAAMEMQHTHMGGQQRVPLPEPDMDELARQVYSILKSRLGVERRRMS